MMACEQANLDLVKYLIIHGANINEKMKNENETALSLTYQKIEEELVNYFFNLKRWTIISHRYGTSALMYACKRENMNMVQYLIEKCKVKLNLQDQYGKNEIMIACQKGNLPIVKYLIDHGGNLWMKDKNGVNSLMYACKSGSLPLIHYLVMEKGSPINEKNYQKESSLEFACSYGKNRIVEYLIEKGANLNNINKQGCTPLMKACYSLRNRPMDWNERDGVLSSIKYLINLGARIDIEDKNHMTALLYFYRSRIYYNDTLLMRKYLKLTVKKLAILQNSINY
ncbi:ankyrin [Anaeromyces robustus]|uniref:Ankyrin n=1 Tax=Anaeromyces robustus TaxID=1754192 RepID=A0A1Y1VU91_9FUNG|nr:ankyrin [Anaeromyces robustus]|eukprot:ORX64878.1 ankyrin [Anaeromyces robustus]